MENEVHIGKIVINLSNKVHRSLSKEAAKFGLTGVQSRVLGYIYHNSGKKDIFQKDIEEDFNIRRSSVTSILQLMEKNGYIKRESVCEDARLKKLVLTEKGLEIQKNVYECIMEFEKSLREELSEEELDIFVDLMNRLSKKIAD